MLLSKPIPNAQLIQSIPSVCLQPYTSSRRAQLLPSLQHNGWDANLGMRIRFYFVETAAL
jgi:hypothetical protein